MSENPRGSILRKRSDKQSHATERKSKMRTENWRGGVLWLPR